MRLATNGVPLQCPALLHFSIFKPVQATECGESTHSISKMPYMWQLVCLLFPSPCIKSTLLIIPTLQITLESSLDLMLPFSHLSPVLHLLAIGFPESHCRNGSIKISVFNLIKSFQCLYSIFSLVLTIPFYILSPTWARSCLWGPLSA